MFHYSTKWIYHGNHTIASFSLLLSHLVCFSTEPKGFILSFTLIYLSFCQDPFGLFFYLALNVIYKQMDIQTYGGGNYGFYHFPW